MNIDASLQALNVFATGVNVTANNIANANTEGFKASRTVLETGPGGQGVAVAAIEKDQTPGPQVPGFVSVTDPATNRIDFQRGYVEGSNTDLGSEMVNLIFDQRAFEANLKTVQTWDQMTGTLIDQMV